MATSAFDLNIEEVLENWEVEHALREVIANALDEQLISGTADIEITKDSRGDWHVRDFGRGLRIGHFTLNENKEKLAALSGVIGKFGVGLKDAVATFFRRSVVVLIRSPFGTFRLNQAPKHGFTDIKTLHVEYDDRHNDMQGTDFCLHGVTDADMAKAKSLFLKFAREDVLESSSYGQILRRKVNAARVYILGVLAAEEPNFLFSYNVTSLTPAMKARLNRERLNVGRTTYTDRVKAILKGAKSPVVVAELIEQVAKRSTGGQADEMAWIEISQKALTLLNERQRVVYLTDAQIQSDPGLVDNIRTDGYHVVTVTDQQRTKLEAQAQAGGPEVHLLETYVREYNDSFQYQFVEPGKLSRDERRIYDATPRILALVGLTVSRLPPIRVSVTMRVTSDNTHGVWDPALSAIVIKRNQLSSLLGYGGTLLHEAGHATSGASDASREFEAVLTGYLGNTSVAALKA